MDLIKPLKQLSLSRKVFHSEADFQFAFAWEIQKIYPDAKVRLEFSPAGIVPSVHIDILIVMEDKWYPIELKYKTLSCTKTCDGETFNLKGHGAQDIGRYDFLKDVQRIEYYKSNLPNHVNGSAILLTNDPIYWSEKNKSGTIFYEFNISEGSVKNGALSWSSNASQGSIKGREKPLVLNDSYKIKWENYSKLDDTRTGTFRYVLLSH